MKEFFTKQQSPFQASVELGQKEHWSAGTAVESRLPARALALALAAILLASGFLASTASAQQAFLTPERYAEGGAGEAFTAFGETYTCSNTTHTAHEVGSTTKGVPNGASAATVTPNYSQECFTAVGHSFTVTTTGCDFVYNIGETTGEPSEGTYAVTTDIVCPEESTGIHWDIYFKGSEHNEGTKICRYTFTPQTGAEGLHATSNAETGDLTISGTLEGIHLDRAGVCIFDGKGTTSVSGSLDTELLVKGTSEAEEAEGISITDEGAESPGKLTSESGSPVTLDLAVPATTLSISQTGEEETNGLTAFGDAVRCPGTTYTGREVGSATRGVPTGATSATITPSYPAECETAGGRIATVVPTGCDFVYRFGQTTGEKEGTYGLSTDVVCPGGASGIEIEVFEKSSEHTEGNRQCLLTVPPQSGPTGAHLTNTAGKEDFDVQGTFSGVHVERSGSCTLDGEGTTTSSGALDVDLTVKGATEGVTITG